MAEEEGKEGEEGAEEEGGGGSKKFLIIIIAVVVLLLGGGGAAFFLFMGGEEETDGDEPKEPVAVLEQATMKPFVVNLSDHMSFLKLTIVIEYDVSLVTKPSSGLAGMGSGGGGAPGDDYDELPGILGERDAIIRDAVIRVLSTKTVEQVLSQEGKEVLKEELIEAINEAAGLDEAPIVAVYFLEFIVQ